MITAKDIVETLIGDLLDLHRRVVLVEYSVTVARSLVSLIHVLSLRRCGHLVGWIKVNLWLPIVWIQALVHGFYKLVVCLYHTNSICRHICIIQRCKGSLQSVIEVTQEETNLS